MKRTQRYLFMLMSILVAAYLLLTRLPWAASVSLLVMIALAYLSLLIWGRDYLIARWRARRRRWPQAVERFQRFERSLLEGKSPRLLLALHPGFYTFDGLALTRQQIAQCLLNTGDLDGAVGWSRAALQRDAEYALPYANLAIVAALRQDEALAQREMSRAVRLGYSAVAAHRALRDAFARAQRASSE